MLLVSVQVTQKVSPSSQFKEIFKDTEIYSLRYREFITLWLKVRGGGAGAVP